MTGGALIRGEHDFRRLVAASVFNVVQVSFRQTPCRTACSAGPAAAPAPATPQYVRQPIKGGCERASRRICRSLQREHLGVFAV